MGVADRKKQSGKSRNTEGQVGNKESKINPNGKQTTVCLVLEKCGASEFRDRGRITEPWHKEESRSLYLCYTQPG